MTWYERCDYVSDGDPRILGEDDTGRLYIPSTTRSGYWDRPFKPADPRHWPFYLRSRLTRRIAFLESA